MRKLKLRERERLAQDHTAGKGQSHRVSRRLLTVHLLHPPHTLLSGDSRRSALEVCMWGQC